MVGVINAADIADVVAHGADEAVGERLVAVGERIVAVGERLEAVGERLVAGKSANRVVAEKGAEVADVVTKTLIK